MAGNRRPSNRTSTMSKKRNKKPTKRIVIISKDFANIIVVQAIGDGVIGGFDIMTEKYTELPHGTYTKVDKDSPLLRMMSEKGRYRLVNNVCKTENEKAKVLGVTNRTVGRYRREYDELILNG